jgi:hypothetical protein
MAMTKGTKNLLLVAALGGVAYMVYKSSSASAATNGTGANRGQQQGNQQGSQQQIGSQPSSPNYGGGGNGGGYQNAAYTNTGSGMGSSPSFLSA